MKHGVAVPAADGEGDDIHCVLYLAPRYAMDVAVMKDKAFVQVGHGINHATRHIHHDSAPDWLI